MLFHFQILSTATSKSNHYCGSVFLASFLSRDEALKLIIDGWLQHGNGSNLITEQQDSISVSSDLDNGIDVIEKVNNFKQASELDSPDRQKATAPSPDSKISASVENGRVSVTQIQVTDEVEQDGEVFHLTVTR
ncbi:PROTEIN VASCULAR ASSOCIATED DEATH 1 CHLOROPLASTIC [Salix koriyanagi]|uniref:PROTEIN VASCULAR ASSOCIATED DEATH 1 CHLOROPLASTIC n=1 Tax=Salix koriyanagi TaxID=2511006 RepID=A0A9Q0WBR0_9ROSI|nr:PROTEIN VASCULAR ASSOCIATED DEATH 1 CHLOROPLASTIC [Salix koriyanagi]